MRRAVVALVLLALAGCGSEGAAPQGTMFLLDTIRQARKGGDEPQVTALALTRAGVAEVDYPLIRIRVEEGARISLMYQGQANARHRTFYDIAKTSFTFRAGVLTATRGLIPDLYQVDAPQLLALLEGSGPAGKAQRIHRRMDATAAIGDEVYDCVLQDAGPEDIVVLDAPAATRYVTEDCTGPAGSFRNQYWQGADGTMWLSKQWLGEDLGYLLVERLVR
ncbi:MAG: YjbF family lipoprotein [Rhodobacterales bacterium]|nr:YjbF family lipoprotein [Rhodobacterales bacterium]